MVWIGTQSGLDRFEPETDSALGEGSFTIIKLIPMALLDHAATTSSRFIKAMRTISGLEQRADCMFLTAERKAGVDPTVTTPDTHKT